MNNMKKSIKKGLALPLFPPKKIKQNVNSSNIIQLNFNKRTTKKIKRSYINQNNNSNSISNSRKALKSNITGTVISALKTDFEEEKKLNNLEILDDYEINNLSYEEALKSDYRDAVDFGPFLIVNGKNRYGKVKSYTWATSRTAIGQREDGTVLILVTDGRGASGHLGATASDLIRIMKDYGAINAANIDGGSSSSMYYNGNYEMKSVTLGLKNSSWRLPTAFIVEER